MSSFDAFDLLPTLAGALRDQGITEPTPIQADVVQALLAGESVIAVAATGSGKTLAFVLPILHRLKAREAGGDPVTEPARPRALVLVPSRELGEQVAKVFKTLTHTTRLRVRTSLGGVGLAVIREGLSAPFEVLVATPGRLTQLLGRGLIDLGDVGTVVLDEADLLLDRGFLADADAIVGATPAGRQVALFTATLPPAVAELAERRLPRATVVRSAGSHRVVSSLTTRNVDVPDGKRLPHLLAELARPVQGTTMIFVNTREQCDRVEESLRARGFRCLAFRSEMNRTERRRNLQAFRDQEVSLLVATDLGARGLDIAHVGRVINAHMPAQREAYLHRAGRTARAGRPGEVINLVTPRDRPMVDWAASVAAE